MLQTIFNCSDGEKQILNINVVVAWSYTLKWQKEIVDHGDHWQVYSSSGREIDNRYPAFVYICSYKGFNHRYPSFSMHAQSSMGFFFITIVPYSWQSSLSLGSRCTCISMQVQFGIAAVKPVVQINVLFYSKTYHKSKCTGREILFWNRQSVGLHSVKNTQKMVKGE